MTPSIPAQQPTNTAQSLGIDLLSTTPVQTPAPAQVPVQNQPPVQAAPSLQPLGNKMLEFQDIALYGQVQPNPQDPRQYALKLNAYNKSSRQLTGYKIAVQTSPGWQCKAQPPTSDKLGPNYSNCVSNIIYLFNPSNTPFGLNVKISYYFGSQPVTENGTIRSLQ